MILEKCIILKGIGGFYYVRSQDGIIYECKARGIFRKERIIPLAGDYCDIDSDIESGKGAIIRIYDRKNFLMRPPVANIDKLIIVSSVAEPKPNLTVIDRLTAQAADKNIEPVVIFSKCDLADADEYVSIYKKCNIMSFAVSSKENLNIEIFSDIFKDSVCALTGNTGVGKSSLLNAVAPELRLETSHISKKLGRGRHTTRSVELFELFGGYIADTPGFSALDFENTELITKENLPFCFPEFIDYIGKCKFVSCSHINDKGCAVVDAVNNGVIPESRHKSYCIMYDEVKSYKAWHDKTKWSRTP